MGIGNPDRLQHALNGAVLARPPVQHHQRHVGLQLIEHGGDIALHIDAGDAIALALERRRARRAGSQRNLTLRRPSAHQNCNVFRAHSFSFWPYLR